MRNRIELQNQGLLAPTMAKDFPNLPIVHAEGCYFYDKDNRKYLDLTAGIATANTGHRHPRVVKAIQQQLEHVIHGPIGIVQYDSIFDLSNRLKTILPSSLNTFFYGNSGTEAVEGAIKLARQVTKKPYIISFTGAFHGRTMGSLSLTTSKSKYRQNLPVGSNVYQLPFANKDHTPENIDYAAYWEEKAEQDFQILFDHIVQPNEIAAVIMEPVLGEGGCIVPPIPWVQKIREICTSYNILLIFDEVQTGFGRTGEWFAFNYFNVIPDILAVAKGIASGLPLGATIASEQLMNQWEIGSHSTTFGGNALACAAGCATIDVLKEETLPLNAKVLGEYAVQELQIIKSKHEGIGHIRGIGLMIGIEIVDPITKKPNSSGLLRILEKCLNKGVILYLSGNKGNIIRMIPPLTITKEQLKYGLSILDEAILEYENEVGMTI